MYIAGRAIQNMTMIHTDSAVYEKSGGNNQGQVTGTGTPAEDREEDREEEREESRLRDLKEDAKWGRDLETQKKAIEDLRKNGISAISYLEEILAVVPPGEIKQYCKSAIDSIIDAQQNEAKKNPVEKA